MSLSRDSLALFAEMLDSVSLPVSSPDFVRDAARFSKAKEEVAAALTDRVAEKDEPIECPTHGGIHFHDENGDIQGVTVRS